MNRFKFLPLLIISLVSITANSQQTVPADTISVTDFTFTKVEEEASFPGGSMAWRKFLEKNLNANTPVDNSAPIGIYTVVVEFIVDKDGTISRITPLTQLGYGMEQEVVKIIRKSGAWSPAMLNKRPVKAYRKQPVTFVVQQDDLDIKIKEQYVFYTGVDNEFTVDAGKLKSEDLQLTISKGTITEAADGKFIARVNSPGRVIIEVSTKRKNRRIGAVSFEVKDPNEKTVKK